MPRYMLMFVGDETRRERSSREERERTYAAVGAWWDELSKKGVVKGGEQLGPSATATTVRRVNGEMKVFDGPFIESKEQVGGYALIEAPDLDEAIRLAKSWPAGDVEVRPVVER
ncbi:MAG TPA: YciI family protein [Candidatus Limnocylindria bacterium]|nr:YciI family protein [Candidatus Limnocylindria bacterium]